MILAILLIAGGGFALNVAQAQQRQEMTGIKRTDLQQHEIAELNSHESGP